MIAPLGNSGGAAEAKFAYVVAAAAAPTMRSAPRREQRPEQVLVAMDGITSFQSRYRTSNEAVSARIIKKLAERADSNPAKYAGHSLRAGHATSRAIAEAGER